MRAYFLVNCELHDRHRIRIYVGYLLYRCTRTQRETESHHHDANFVVIGSTTGYHPCVPPVATKLVHVSWTTICGVSRDSKIWCQEWQHTVPSMTTKLVKWQWRQFVVSPTTSNGWRHDSCPVYSVVSSIKNYRWPGTVRSQTIIGLARFEFCISMGLELQGWGLENFIASHAEKQYRLALTLHHHLCMMSRLLFFSCGKVLGTKHVCLQFPFW